MGWRLAISLVLLGSDRFGPVFTTNVQQVCQLPLRPTTADGVGWTHIDLDVLIHHARTCTHRARERKCDIVAGGVRVACLLCRGRARGGMS